MTDLPLGFWSGWVIVLSSVGFVALLWLVVNIYFGKQTTAHAQAEPVWDDDLQEGNNPAPLWWFWMILAAMVFSVIYLLLYPGLGSYAGALNWSQVGQLHEHQAHAAQAVQAEHQALLQAPYEELTNNSAVLASAERLFKDNCAACHGANAQGQSSAFPNLRDGDWLWGGTAEQLTQTIQQGRNAVMIPWLAVLGEQGVDNVANYVLALGTPQAEGHAGQAQFTQLCSACHGPTGDGNPLLGAPRLNDDIWLYGGELATVKATIAAGRNGQMPAFGNRLNELQIKMLVAWLLAQPQ